MIRKQPMLTGLVFVCSLTFLAGSGFAASSKAKLTMQQARAIASKKKSGQIKSEELEKEKGRMIYSFDIQRANQIHEVNVDASTGEVVEDSVEDPAVEAKENAQEAKHNKTSPQQ